MRSKRVKNTGTSASLFESLYGSRLAATVISCACCAARLRTGRHELPGKLSSYASPAYGGAKACLRSASRSAASSTPIESCTVPGDTPAAANSSTDMWWWEM